VTYFSNSIDEYTPVRAIKETIIGLSTLLKFMGPWNNPGGIWTIEVELMIFISLSSPM
jgi:hypothetical protein